MGEPNVKEDESKSPSSEIQVATATPITTLRSEFYEAYKRQAKIFDKELKEYNKELNITLLFATLFAVVASTFLGLGESNHLLLAQDNRQAVSTITIIVSCSLAASIIVAVLALFAKRSLKRYAILDFNAANLSQNRYRPPSAFHRFVPRIFWFFIEGLSLVLQAALLVVACVLANHLWTQDQRAVSLTVGGVEVLCIILIASTTIGPTLLGLSGGAVTNGIKKPLLQALVSTQPNVKKFRERTLPRRRPSILVSDDEKSEKLEITSIDDIPLIFERQVIDWTGFASDSLCVTWMFDRCIDSDEGTVILDFATEIVWHSGICEVPLAKIFEIFDKCFDYSRGTTTLIPRLRDRAYKAGRALVHLIVQRKCIGEEDSDPLEGLRGTRGPYSSRSYDNELDSILNIVDGLFGTPQPIDWTKFTFSESHQRWLSHILLYRAWDHLCYASELPDDVKAFVTKTFSTKDTHPAVIADCLFIISLVIGIPLRVDDLAVDDKSSESEALHTRIFTKFESTFTNHVVEGYARSLYAMRLITPLENENVAKLSYSLFRVILSSSFEEEKLWVAARVAIHGTYKWDHFLPWVEDPDDILKCLTYHFAIQAKGEDDVAKQPIEDILRGLAYASGEKTLESLKKVDFREKSFVNGLRKAFEEDRPFQTRKSALFFFPRMQVKWFDDSLEDVMSDEEKDGFCKVWGSAVDGIEHTTDVQEAVCATFFLMLNSSKWRSHIPKEKLKLMEYFPNLPDDSNYITLCKNNVSILPWLRSRAEEAGEEGKEEVRWWKLWLTVLWTEYGSLPQDVKDQVLDVTKVVISKARHDANFISKVMAGKKQKYETQLGGYATTSLDAEAERLRARVEALNEAMEKFVEVVGKKAE